MTSGTVYIGSRAPRPMNRLPVDNITAPENVNLSSTVGDYIILTVDSLDILLHLLDDSPPIEDCTRSCKLSQLMLNERVL